MQGRLAETRAVAINIVADNRPAHRSGVNAQLMGAAGDGLEREPGEAVAATTHLPVGNSLLPLRIGLLPPAALGVEPAERHVDDAFILGRAAFDDRPVGFGDLAMLEQQAERRRRLAVASQYKAAGCIA